MKFKLNVPVLFSIIMLIIVVSTLIVALPLMFGTVDNVAEDNNVSTGEYGTQYDSGQTLIKYAIIFLEAADIALGILFFVMILKGFL